MAKSRFNLRKIGLIIILLSTGAIIFSSIPFIVYYLTFKDSKVSSEPSDWAEFGSYISGTSGVLLSFFAVVFALTSIYFTTKIAQFIQQRDFEFSKKQSEDQLKLTYAQSKPYPFIDLTKLPNRTSIIIQNMGLGPLIVKEITVTYCKTENFKNFKDLLTNKLQIKSTKGAQIIYNSAPNHILAPNSSKSILQLNPEKECQVDFKDIQTSCRNILKNCEITFKYEDIYKNEFEYRKELSFLKE